MKTFYQMNGLYDLQTAKEILIPIFEKEIQHYQAENFSSEIRFGKENPEAISRMNYLENMLQELKNLVKNASTQNTNLKINTTLNISIDEIKPE